MSSNSRYDIVIVLAILSCVETKISEPALSSMVLSDDECMNKGNADCALSAIQVQASGQSKVLGMAGGHASVVRVEAGFCKICHGTCQDHTTYGLLDRCNTHPMCRLKDAVEPNTSSTCICAQNSCKKNASLQPDLTAQEDLSDDVPVQEGSSDDLGSSWSGCRRRRYCGHASGGSCASFGCGGAYVRWHGCQCNQECERHGNCCSDYHQKCVSTPAPPPPPPPPSPPPQISQNSNIKTLYHTTSSTIAKLIVSGNFKPGSQGWCGGAVYFMDYPGLPKSKEDPLTTQRGAVVEAQVDLGKVCQSTRDQNCWESQEGTCCPMPGGGHGIQGAAAAGCGSILWNPGDGNEYVLWDMSRILSRKIYNR